LVDIAAHFSAKISVLWDLQRSFARVRSKRLAFVPLGTHHRASPTRLCRGGPSAGQFDAYLRRSVRRVSPQGVEPSRASAKRLARDAKVFARGERACPVGRQSGEPAATTRKFDHLGSCCMSEVAAVPMTLDRAD
jgi:hypothetical protein